MAVRKGALQSDIHRVFEPGPPIVERARLESAPIAGSVEFYFLTAAAERAWAAINERRARGGGALFWISGPAGAGKTHFLNYVLALEDRAGAGTERRAIVRLQADGPVRADVFERRLLEGLAREIGTAGRESALWRRMRGAQAVEVALGHARRFGIRALSLAIDLGATDAAAMSECFAELERGVGAARDLALRVFVASRDAPILEALALEVAPANEDERILAAMARARRVIDREAAAALYRNVHCGRFEPRAIFPFHPLALRALHALVDLPATIAALSGLVAEVLAEFRERVVDPYERPLMPPDLLRAGPIAERVNERLGEGGRAALALAYRAADTMRHRVRAREAVAALALQALGNGRPLAPRELRAHLPAEQDASDAGLSRMLEILAARGAGAIVLDGRGARFDARAARAAEVAAFNAALTLIQRFDATAEAAAESAELDGRFKQLDNAMRGALEQAHRVAAALETVEGGGLGAPASEYRRTLDGFIALAAGGARALVELGADGARRERALRLVGSYEDLAMAAAAIVRMRAMREYLRATGLRPDFVRDRQSAEDGADALVVECQLLLAALDAGVLPDAQRRFEALEARFEKFKWTYLAAYREAHERWRRQSERLAAELADAREHHAALARLNSIPALGAPQGAGLGERLEELARAIGRCEGDAMTGPDTARCARCGFVLGTTLPEREILDAFVQVKRSLKARLAALSHGAIARLIRTHDRGHRLDGFLKITQAAHTEALVRVLDDNLAAYLAQLLEELDDEGAVSEQLRQRSPGELRRFVRPRRAGSDPPDARRPPRPPNREN